MYYFASDLHLGLGADSAARERLFVKWLDEVGRDAEAIFLVGDIFDFWYEYRHVVPQGFTRLLGKLSELTDNGVEIHHFAGNHDMWMYGYLERECSVRLHHAAYYIFELYGKRVMIGHGDLLGEQISYDRFLSRTFSSRLLRKLFGWIHPDIALSLGLYWSRNNRHKKPVKRTFQDEEEPIVGFAMEYLKKEHIDLFVSGHTHLAEIYPLGDRSAIAFLGEWIEEPTYGVLSGEGFELKRYKP